jgi:hypothetical protein
VLETLSKSESGIGFSVQWHLLVKIDSSVRRNRKMLEVIKSSPYRAAIPVILAFLVLNGKSRISSQWKFAVVASLIAIYVVQFLKKEFIAEIGITLGLFLFLIINIVLPPKKNDQLPNRETKKTPPLSSRTPKRPEVNFTGKTPISNVATPVKADIRPSTPPQTLSKEEKLSAKEILAKAREEAMKRQEEYVQQRVNALLSPKKN